MQVIAMAVSIFGGDWPPPVVAVGIRTPDRLTARHYRTAYNRWGTRGSDPRSCYTPRGVAQYRPSRGGA
jgi:hypothetical protein